MRATAKAQPNIALIKYWGKRDIERNLPAVGSISITLDALATTMTVDLDAGVETDELIVNNEPNEQMLPRISKCLDNVLGRDRSRARILSKSNFPIAAGLASSASSFAALTVGAAKAAGLDADTARLSRLAGEASGSAARSLYGGFAELANDDDSIRVEQICSESGWPLKVVVAITETGPKAVGSTEAMEISRKTSPFYSNWIEQQPSDLETARSAIVGRDFEKLAAIAEHNCLKMHSVMWASRPPTVFWNEATMRCLTTVRQLQAEGRGVFFTIDAGPQIKAVCLPDDVEAVRDALGATDGVEGLMETDLGPGARIVDETCDA